MMGVCDRGYELTEGVPDRGICRWYGYYIQRRSRVCGRRLCLIIYYYVGVLSQTWGMVVYVYVGYWCLLVGKIGRNDIMSVRVVGELWYRVNRVNMR